MNYQTSDSLIILFLNPWDREACDPRPNPVIATMRDLIVFGTLLYEAHG